MKKKKLAGLILVVVTLSIISSVHAEMLVSEVNVSYESEILDEFQNRSEVPVLVRLRDNSGLPVTSVEERTEWFKPVLENVLFTLSEEEFDIVGKHSSEFRGYITEQGFNKLINNRDIGEIILEEEGMVHATLSENETTDSFDIEKEVKKNNLLWLWIIIGTIVIIILYILIRRRK